MKKEYQKKYQPNQPEDLHSNGRVNRLAFVSRIVNTENRPLSVKEAWTLVNKRDAKQIGLNQHRFGAALSAAVRGGRIDKTRIQDSDTKTTVSFHPLGMKPMGLDIPVPLYTRDTTPDDDVFNIDAVSWETIECGNCDATFTIDEGLDIGGIDYCRECYDTISAKDDVENEDEAIMDFDVERMNKRDAIVSTIQHHFTAEQLLDTLNNLNPNLHDDVLVAIYEALGKNIYIGLGSLLEPEPRKTACMKWSFVNGNLVVKE